jgi:hypothetical protein
MKNTVVGKKANHVHTVQHFVKMCYYLQYAGTETQCDAATVSALTAPTPALTAYSKCTE